MSDINCEIALDKGIITEESLRLSGARKTAYGELRRGRALMGAILLRVTVRESHRTDIKYWEHTVRQSDASRENTKDWQTLAKSKWDVCI